MVKNPKRVKEETTLPTTDELAVPNEESATYNYTKWYIAFGAAVIIAITLFKPESKVVESKVVESKVVEGEKKAPVKKKTTFELRDDF